MTRARKNRKRRQKRAEAPQAAAEDFGHPKARPTRERLQRGVWALREAEDEDGNLTAGLKHARDLEAHPIDRLENRSTITKEQAQAGRDFEALYRAANEAPGIRDSTTLWQPKGHENDDGNVAAVRDRKELYLFLGTMRDQLLRRVCVQHEYPRPREIAALREALSECERFFT